MSDIINIGGISVSKFYLGGFSDVKIYLGSTKLYPHLQEPCFAVVDNISTYTARTYVDVYETSSDKWYKLNNLTQYEEYGIYGSGRTITYYEGKLTIDGDYEYQYSGSGWNNVGEISGSSRIPLNFTEVEYVENTTNAYINTGVYLYDSTTNSYTIQCKHYFQSYSRDFEYLFGTEGTSSPYVGVIFRYYQRNIQYAGYPDNVSWTHIDNGDGTSGITASCASTNATNGNNPLTLFCGLWSTGPWRFGRGKIYSFTVTMNNSIVRDLVPCKRNSDNMVGMYDIVNDVFYYPPNYTSYQLVAGSATGTTIYPIYYDVIQDPPNNLSFSSMTEAEEYECPWVGMHATIDGDRYIFSGDSISGYEWVYNPSRLPYGYTEVEYIERNASHNGYVGLGEYFQTNTRIQIDFQMTQAKGFAIIGDYFKNDSDDWRVFLNYDSQVNNWLIYDFTNSRNYYNTGDWSKRFNIEIGNYYIKDLDTGNYLINTSAKTGFSRPNQMYLFHLDGTQNTNNIDYGRIYSLKIWQNDVLVKEFVPCQRDSDNAVGLYDIVNDEFHNSSGGTMVAGDPV